MSDCSGALTRNFLEILEQVAKMGKSAVENKFLIRPKQCLAVRVTYRWKGVGVTSTVTESSVT